MSNSTTNLDLISAGQAQKEVSANAMLDAASPAMLFGRRASTTAALTWGYYGGTILVSSAPTQIANGTVALTASATNYVEATTAGAVSANTTAFTAGRAKLYTVVTGAATVTSYTDQRTPSGGGAAVDITNTPAGNIAATNVQAALNELDAEKALLAGSSTQDFAAKILTTSADASIQGITVGRGGSALATNTVMGSLALSANTTGVGNTAQGNSALRSSTTARFNTAQGDSALYSTISGEFNVAQGDNALYSNISGDFNCAQGSAALYGNKKGSNNCAQGESTLASNTTGDSNCAQGAGALLLNRTGSFNCGQGGRSLIYNTTGSNNCAQGYETLFDISPTSLDISAFADYSATVAGTVRATSTAHGRATGNSLIISGTTNFNGTRTVTVIDANSFYFTAAWVSLAGENGWWTLAGFVASNNTAVGYGTGRGITTGSGNTILGANVTGLAANLTNNIIIADGAGNQRINVDSAGNIRTAATIATAGYTVATLPAGTVGQRAYVTDATAPAYNAALVGGGAVTVPVFRNATVWVSA